MTNELVLSDAFQIRRVADVISTQPKRYKAQKAEYQLSGSIPVIDQGASFVGGYVSDIKKAHNGELPVIVFGDHTCCLKYVDFVFAVGADGTQLIRAADGVDTRYLYYALHTVSLEQFGYQRHFKLLKECEVSIPSLSVQHRIASILGAYDDLIEVNRRRIALLEKMARELFEEWFIRFRFPGHETVTITDTSDGPLPEDWKVGTIRDIAELRSGYAFKSADFVAEGQYSLVTIKHVHDGRLVPPFDSRLDHLPSNMPTHCKINSGEILLSLTGNVGRTCLAWGNNILLNQRVAIVHPRQSDFGAFCYCLFRHPNTLSRLKNIANGAAQQNLSPIQTMNLSQVIPPVELTARFQSQIDPVLRLILRDHKASANLESQRDLLLPRLVSGELSVTSAERGLENSA